MNLQPHRTARLSAATRNSERAGARAILLVLVVLALGLGGALFYNHSLHRGTPDELPKLSDATKAVLQSLDAPVELRFYSLLAPPDATLPAFADRVERLLSAYEREAGGKLTFSRQAAMSDATANAAAKDGVKAFNLEKGDACFLGIAVVQANHREALAQLSPDWEPALESDLTRALVRVLSKPPVVIPAETVKNAAAADEAVKTMIPNVAAVSLEDGSRQIRDTSLKEFRDTMTELEGRVKEAEQRIEQTQASGSEAEQQAARKQLQDVQKERAAKLQQIAEQAMARVAAWERLKKIPAPPAAGAGQ